MSGSDFKCFFWHYAAFKLKNFSSLKLKLNQFCHKTRYISIFFSNYLIMNLTVYPETMLNDKNLIEIN